MALYDWASGNSVDVSPRMVSMALVLRRVGAILGNGYGIQGQNYVVFSMNTSSSIRH